MPYRTDAELPPGVKDNLPPYAQDIYRGIQPRLAGIPGRLQEKRQRIAGRGRPQGRLDNGEAEIREDRRGMASQGLAAYAFRPANSQ